MVARFCGVEDAMMVSMGFATNAGGLTALAKEGTLVLSDELNHASIRLGARGSGATVRCYRHNDMRDLEKKLREGISAGRKEGEKWDKILVVVEGLYSMEGTLVDLPRILELKDKYKVLSLSLSCYRPNELKLIYASSSTSMSTRRTRLARWDRTVEAFATTLALILDGLTSSWARSPSVRCFSFPLLLPPSLPHPERS